MRPQTFGASAGAATGTAPARTATRLPAQTIDALAVHIPRPVMVDGRVLAAGNYTISALKGAAGANPILRFQSESGEAVSVLVTREDLTFDRVLMASEVTLAPTGTDIPRVERVMMEGNGFQFLLPVSHFSN
ncbi:MAG TPA: hypothetical protein VGL53_06285 [Bryobacteraceae bacterium]